MTQQQSQAVHDALAAVLSEFCEMHPDDIAKIWGRRLAARTEVDSKTGGKYATALAEIMEGYGLRFNEWREQHDKN